MRRRFPLSDGRMVDLVEEGRRRLGQLVLLADDPQDPDCDRSVLALSLALRAVLRRALETLECYDEEFLAGTPLGIRGHYLGERVMASRVIVEVTEALDGLPEKKEERL